MTDEQYYKELRETAYKGAMRIFPGVQLGAIDHIAVQAAETGEFTWAWDDDDNAHLAARFEVAVWENDKLTGLCRGKPVESNSRLHLEIVEAAPNIPLRERQSLLPIISACTALYANMLGVSEIRIVEPVSPSRIRLYEGLGFKYVAAGNYLVMEV